MIKIMVKKAQGTLDAYGFPTQDLEDYNKVAVSPPQAPTTQTNLTVGHGGLPNKYGMGWDEVPGVDDVSRRLSTEEMNWQIERLLDDSGFKYPLTQNIPTSIEENRGDDKAYGFGGNKSVFGDVMDNLTNLHPSRTPYGTDNENLQFADHINRIKGLGSKAGHIAPESIRDLIHPQTTLPEYDWNMESERWLDDKGEPIPGTIPPVNAIRLSGARDVRPMLANRGGFVPKPSSFKGFESGVSDYPFATKGDKGRGFFLTSADMTNLREAVAAHAGEDEIPVGIRGFRQDAPDVQSRPRSGQSENVTEAMVDRHIPMENLVVPRTPNAMLTRQGMQSPRGIFRNNWLHNQNITNEERADLQNHLKNLKFDAGFHPLSQISSSYADSDLPSSNRNIGNIGYGVHLNREKNLENDDIPALLNLMNNINLREFPELYDDLIDRKTHMPIVSGHPIPLSYMKDPEMRDTIVAYLRSLVSNRQAMKDTTPPSWGSRMKQLEGLTEDEKREYLQQLGG